MSKLQTTIPCDEDDEVAAVEDADGDEDDAHPEAHPQPERKVLKAVLAEKTLYNLQSLSDIMTA